MLGGPRWEINAVRSYSAFFRFLPTLVPPSSLLCLAEGVWDAELTSFFHRYTCKPPDGLFQPAEFEDGAYVPIDESLLVELANISLRHAGPEIAMCVAVSCGTVQVLEWFDAPSDPISVALSIPQNAVEQFCRLVGAEYRKV